MAPRARSVRGAVRYFEKSMRFQQTTSSATAPHRDLRKTCSTTLSLVASSREHTHDQADEGGADQRATTAVGKAGRPASFCSTTELLQAGTSLAGRILAAQHQPPNVWRHQYGRRRSYGRRNFPERLKVALPGMSPAWEAGRTFGPARPGTAMVAAPDRGSAGAVSPRRPFPCDVRSGRRSVGTGSGCPAGRATPRGGTGPRRPAGPSPSALRWCRRTG